MLKLEHQTYFETLILWLETGKVIQWIVKEAVLWRMYRDNLRQTGFETDLCNYIGFAC